jgi:tetratricopeptide (TPR) repeat protein
MHKIFLLALLLNIFHLSWAQTGIVKKALKMQAKGKIEKAEKLVFKVLEKDSLSSAGLYAYAALLFDTAYIGYDLDKAYEKLMASRQSFDSLKEKQMSRHLKIGINAHSINSLKNDIDSTAFARAVKENTEGRFIYFINTFQSAIQLSEAERFRDSLAFITARAENTYQAYENFMAKYPKALQITEAKKRYEKLYFDKNTADGKMESFVKFLGLHPTTPYRDEAEKNIFEIATADNTPQSYLRFMDKYPKSKQASRARRYLYHDYKSLNVIDKFPKKWVTDSLKQVMHLDEKGPLILFLKSKKYGFMDFFGEEIIGPQFDKIDADLLCTPLIDDVFSTGKGLKSRNGATIYQGKYDEIEDLGFGVMKLTIGKRVLVIHKSGWQITTKSMQDIRLLGGQFLAYKSNGKWGLMTLSGRVISKPKFDNISMQGLFYIFESAGHYDVLNGKVLAESVNQRPINFQMLFTDFELLDDNHLWLQSSFGETIFDENLNEVVPYNQQQINTLKNGYLVQKKDGFEVKNSQLKTEVTLSTKKVRYNDSFVAFKAETFWTLYKLETYKLLGNFDSVAVYGNGFAIGVRSDSAKIFFGNGKQIITNDLVNVKFLANSGSSQYLAVRFSKSNDVRYFNIKGEMVLSGEFDEITPLGSEYLVVTKRGKRGLVSNNGQQLLPAKYDAVANYSNGYVSTLLNKNFGLVNVTKGVNVPADYEKNIQPYNHSLLVATKTGLSGLINGAGKNISEFSFEEIKYWNDSIALVKQNHLWKFYDIYNNSIGEIGIKSLQYLKDSKEEIVVIALVENGYGVYSSTRGEIIAPTFNDIINIGTTENMIFFTEKHVEEAEFYVVIYYDKNGKIIRKQAFESPDYMLIYCDQ